MFRFTIVLVSVILASAFDIKDLREQMLSDDDLLTAKDECLQELKLTYEEIINKKQRMKDDELPEDLLCFVKCIQEKREYVKDGELDMNAIEDLPVFSIVGDEKKKEVIECLQKIEKINVCQDVNEEIKCMIDVFP